MNQRRFHDLYLCRDLLLEWLKNYLDWKFFYLPAALLPEPALLVGIEEGVHQIVAIVLGYLEGLCAYRLVQ